MPTLKSSLTCGFLACLAACASVPLTSLPKLAALSPDTLDFAGMEVAVRFPADFSLPADAVTLTFEAGPVAKGPTEKESFHLERIAGKLDAGLQTQQKAGFRIERFRFLASDAARAERFREAVQAMKALPGKKSFSLSAKAVPCLNPGANPFQDVRVAIYLRPEPADDYFPLVKETRLDLPETENGAVKRCAASG